MIAASKKRKAGRDDMEDEAKRSRLEGEADGAGKEEQTAARSKKKKLKGKKLKAGKIVNGKKKFRKVKKSDGRKEDKTKAKKKKMKKGLDVPET